MGAATEEVAVARHDDFHLNVRVCQMLIKYGAEVCPWRGLRS